MEKGCSGPSCFATGWSPSPPPSHPSSFQEPPLPYTHFHPTLGLKLENQPSSAQRAQKTPRMSSSPSLCPSPPHQAENNRHPRPALRPSQERSHAAHRGCFTLTEARRNESFLRDLQVHQRHISEPTFHMVLQRESAHAWNTVYGIT